MRFILQLQQMRAVFYFYLFIFVKSEGTYACILLCFSDFISFGPTL